LAQLSLRDEHGKHLGYIKKRLAISLVDRGFATFGPNRNSILSVPIQPVGPHLRCGQQRPYEQLGIEKFPIVFLGGLTRTEHKPAKFDRHKGARVGHQ
jgi:hypothetical protein